MGVSCTICALMCVPEPAPRLLDDMASMPPVDLAEGVVALWLTLPGLVVVNAVLTLQRCCPTLLKQVQGLRERWDAPSFCSRAFTAVHALPFGVAGEALLQRVQRLVQRSPQCNHADLARS